MPGDEERDQESSTIDKALESAREGHRDSTSSKQTTLHDRVRNGSLSEAVEMVKKADAEMLKQIDDQGNTVLHLAAARKDNKVDVCCQVFETWECHIDVQLPIRVRNGKGHWPLLVAALSGSTEVCKFLAEKDEDTLWETTEDGNNVLHHAILSNRFKIAAAIVRSDDWKEYYNNRNKKGQTALHILAEKATAFRSRVPLEPADRFLYTIVFSAPNDQCAEQISIQKHHKKEVAEGSKPSAGESSKIQDPEDPQPQDLPKDHKGWNTKLLKVGRVCFFCCVLGILLPMYLLYWSVLSIVDVLLRVAVMLLSPVSTFGRGFSNRLAEPRSRRMKGFKERHSIANEIMEKLVAEYKFTDKDNTELNVTQYISCDNKKKKVTIKAAKGSDQPVESPLLIAAKMGIIEMVKEFFKKSGTELNAVPNSEGKKAVMVAVIHRQADVFEYLKKENVDIHWEDNCHSNILHAAAINDEHHHPWRMLGETMKMHWEIKWYEYVKRSLPANFTEARNSLKKTPAEVFKTTHDKFFRKVENGEWLNKTAQSCSVVASLIATVAFASATTIPGGNDDHGNPNFQGKSAFITYVISAYVALCCSLYSLVTFLTVLLSPYHAFGDFSLSLPEKLILGITNLLISIGAMLISFAAGHYFFIKEHIARWAIPVYIIVSLPVIKMVLTQIPLYTHLLFSVYKPKPRPWYSEFSFENDIPLDE